MWLISWPLLQASVCAETRKTRQQKENKSVDVDIQTPSPKCFSHVIHMSSICRLCLRLLRSLLGYKGLEDLVAPTLSGQDTFPTLLLASPVKVQQKGQHNLNCKHGKSSEEQKNSHRNPLTQKAEASAIAAAYLLADSCQEGSSSSGFFCYQLFLTGWRPSLLGWRQLLVGCTWEALMQSLLLLLISLLLQLCFCLMASNFGTEAINIVKHQSRVRMCCKPFPQLFPNSHAMGSCKTNRRTGAVGSPSELVGGWCPGHVLMASGSCDACPGHVLMVSRSCFEGVPVML